MSTFGRVAPRLVAEGYRPIPVRPSSKVPSAGRGWLARPDARTWRRWMTRCADHGVGLVCGAIVGVDIDVLEPEAAGRLVNLAVALLGPTPLIRVGRAPKTLLVFRVCEPLKTTRTALSCGRIEILAEGAHFVGWGLHPDTGAQYRWVGEGTPLDTPSSDLPMVTPLQLEDLVTQAFRLFPAKLDLDHKSMPAKAARGRNGIIRCRSSGRVLDGRDSFLAAVVFDLWRARDRWTAEELASAAWQEFAATADLTRPARDGKRSWQPRDALAKARALLRKALRGEVRRVAKSRGRVVKPPGHNPLDEDLARFRAHVVDLHRRGHLSSRALIVSELMLERLVGGAFVDAVAIAAKALSLSPSTVQRARAELLLAGLWSTARQLGNRVSTSPYFPTIPEAAKPIETITESLGGMSDVTPIYQEGVGVDGGRHLDPIQDRTSLVPAPHHDDVQLPLLPARYTADRTREALEAWTSGPMPDEAKALHADRRNAMMLRERDVAVDVGLSREHVSNGRSGTFGFSPAAASRFKHHLISGAASAHSRRYESETATSSPRWSALSCGRSDTAATRATAVRGDQRASPARGWPRRRE